MEHMMGMWMHCVVQLVSYRPFLCFLVVWCFLNVEMIILHSSRVTSSNTLSCNKASLLTLLCGSIYCALTFFIILWIFSVINLIRSLPHGHSEMSKSYPANLFHWSLSGNVTFLAISVSSKVMQHATLKKPQWLSFSTCLCL